MEQTSIPGTPLTVSRIALGTWAIGGWMWGGTDEKESIRTIHAALDKGINLIDTAPVYGFGRSEKIVGKALAEYGQRADLFISTKAGLDWKDGKVFRNASRERIEKEVADSLGRLGTDYIDIYFIHWPDPTVDFGETAEAMEKLLEAGKIRAIGLSNFTPEQMAAFGETARPHVCQPPYNLFERGIESDVKPYCHDNTIALMTYGALCRGLLSGKMSKDRQFIGDDLRQYDPKFNPPRFDHYLGTAGKLERFARRNYGKSLLALAVRWALDQEVEIALWGGRRPGQMAPVDEVTGWAIDEDGKNQVDAILREAIPDPVGPGFMAPPDRHSV